MDATELSSEEMEKFVIRFKDLPNRVSPVRLVDMALPEFERKRYPVVGRSTEQSWPDKRVGEVEAFNLNFVSCNPKCGIAVHAHDSDEAFVILTGRWLISFGESNVTDIEVEPYDVVSVPPNVMHGLTNLSNSESFLLAAQGAHRGAAIKWSPRLVERVRALGLDAASVEHPGQTVS
ncbi:MAG: hypothetical protein CFH37_01194 [Alphaproteobacteria bacterium MarineAlpha9_Bin7]|nr:MAG: hypothetical protein CFH37_01194 [Alphaproteobacteria bacterium MarineAlpha9_Bin7]